MTDSISDRRGLWRILDELASARFVDLTHSFAPGIPHASDMPDEQREHLFDFKEDGFRADLYSFAGQWGTHVDPPLHYHEDGRSLSEIDVREMLLPLVVIDVEAKVEEDPDYSLSTQDLLEWEGTNGQVPRRAFAALRTGWARRWPNADQMSNADAEGTFHFPGWSVEALTILVEERGIVACGHETTDTDPGVLVSRDEFPAETYILGTGCFQIEMLASLDGLPPTGGLVVCAFPKPEGGSGFPARVFAIAR